MHKRTWEKAFTDIWDEFNSTKQCDGNHRGHYTDNTSRNTKILLSLGYRYSYRYSGDKYLLVHPKLNSFHSSNITTDTLCTYKPLINLNTSKNNITFNKRVAKNCKCPLCKNTIIFMHGMGWDYDTEFCSNGECNYEKVYETTSNLDDE